jgi:hypothetical protein
LLGAWFIFKEAIEPHWTIRLAGWLRPGPPPVALALDDGLALHLYADTRPHVGKITPLQKGLALAVDGQEWIEEGYGFGAPIVIYAGRSFLSGEAAVVEITRGRQAVKRFEIGLEDTWTQPLRRKYRPVPALGQIVFTYTVSAPGVLEIAADFGGLRVTPDLVYLTNEQGARPFTHYADSTGINRRLDDRPDTPDQWVATTAERACLAAPSWQGVGGLRFCVETPPGQPKYYGRERYLQFRWSGAFLLSWAGADIELARPAGAYRYRVTVERRP